MIYVANFPTYLMEPINSHLKLYKTMHTLNIYCFSIGVKCLSESKTQANFPPNSYVTLDIKSINQTGLTIKNT